MPRPAKHPKPSEMLVQSTMTGLAALVRLVEARSDSDGERDVQSIVRNWSEAKAAYLRSRADGDADFSPIQDAEHVFRQRFLEIIWQSTRRYGNTEFRRVYSWREGTIGPLNGLLNYAGARMRDLAVTMYPFPKPEYYHVRKYPDGSTEVIHRSLAVKLAKEHGVKTHWRAGYPGNRKTPRFLLSHPSLPEMDFVDMIRAHVFELCHQLFIYAVPIAEAHRYIRRTIHALRPFLDWVYSGGQTGRKDFYPDADRELRRIVVEIRTLYSKRTAPPRRPSQERGPDDLPELTLRDIRDKAARTHRESQEPAERNNASRILDLIDTGVVVENDVERLRSRAQEMTRREGNDWHRVLLSQFHTPSSLRQVVFHGDSMLSEVSDKLFLSEVPVDTRHGTGMADLMLSVRRSVGGRTAWTPVGLFEIKTKTAFDASLFGVRPRTKRENVFAPEFYLWKCALTDDDWQATASSAPQPGHMEQLALYEQAIIQEYARLVPNDISAPTSLRKGVFVLDTAQEFRSVAEAFAQLTRYLADHLGQLDNRNWTVTQLDDSMPPRVALVMCPEKGVSHLPRDGVPPNRVPTEDPFSKRVADDRLLTEYISIASPTSGGRAAAWYSKNWHLLNHILEVKDNSRFPVRVVWLDLLDELPPQLREARLGVESARETGQITGSHYSRLRSLVEDTSFLQMWAAVERSIYDGSDSQLLRMLSDVEQSKGRESDELIVVVDGWSELSWTIPTRLEGRLRVLEQTILDSLPREQTNIIWVSEGTQHTANSFLYQRRCLRPLEHDSPRKYELDEVIWNVPVRPRVLGWQTPWSTEHRVIIQDTPTDVPPWRCVITVPHMAEWAARFRGIASRRRTVPASEVTAVTEHPMHGRLVTLASVQSQPAYVSREDAEQLMDDALELAPSLLRVRGAAEEQEGDLFSSVPTLVTRAVVGDGQSVLVDRIHLALDRPPPEPGRARNRYVPAKMIMRGWIHKSTSEHETEGRQKRVSRSPPQCGRTEIIDVDTSDIRKREVRRVLRAARYLKPLTQPYEELHDLCHEIIGLCHDVLRETGDDDTPLTEPEKREAYGRALVTVRDLMLARPQHRRAWAMLGRERESIRDVLTSDNRDVLAAALEEEPELLTLYGHNLFLAILVAVNSAANDPALPVAVPLWRTVAQWQVYQMGFRPAGTPEHMAKPMYDISSIYSGLLWRAKTLLRTQQRTGSQTRVMTPETQASYRVGLIFSAGADEPLWVLLPVSDGNYAIGLTGSVTLGTWWMKCVSEMEELQTAAKEMLNTFEPGNATPLLVTRYADTELLSLWDEESKVWLPMGMLRSRLVWRRKYQLDWLSIDALPQSVQPSDSTEIPLPDSRRLGVVVRRLLRKLAEPSEESVRVGCSVSIDSNREVYTVIFSSGNTKLQTFTTESTENLTKTLREPQHAQMTDRAGRVMQWDPRTDISYTSTDSLRPQIEGSWAFRRIVPYPRTAAELLNAEAGREVTLVVHEETSRVGRAFRIGLEGVPEGSALRSLDAASLTMREIWMLCSCGALFDPADNSCRPIIIDASEVTDERLLQDLASDELQDRVVGLEREADKREEDLAQYGRTEMPYVAADESEVGEEVVLDGDDREVKLVGVEAYWRRKDRERRVRIWLAPIDGSGDLIERTVVPRITPKMILSRGEVEETVSRSLNGFRLPDGEFRKSCRRFIRVLRSEGVRVVRGPDE